LNREAAVLRAAAVSGRPIDTKTAIGVADRVDIIADITCAMFGLDAPAK
jgi:hypothetical protein